MTEYHGVYRQHREYRTGRFVAHYCIQYCIGTSNFINYINHCQCHFYADDMQLYYSFPPSKIDRACSDVKSNIENLSFKNHSLHLSSAKTDLILFGTEIFRTKLLHHSKIKIVVNGQNTPLKTTVPLTNLGAILNDNLISREHVSHCVQRSYAALKMIYANKNHQTLGRNCASL